MLCGSLDEEQALVGLPDLHFKRGFDICPEEHFSCSAAACKQTLYHVRSKRARQQVSASSDPLQAQGGPLSVRLERQHSLLTTCRAEREKEYTLPQRATRATRCRHTPSQINGRTAKLCQKKRPDLGVKGLGHTRAGLSARFLQAAAKRADRGSYCAESSRYPCSSKFGPGSSTDC